MSDDAAVLARIYARCERQPSGCLIWGGGLDKDGYGKTARDGAHQRVHRLVWTLEKGPIPEGLVIDHVRDRGCTSRACCAVEHLEPVTRRENWERSDAPSRLRRDAPTCSRGHDLTDPANYYPTRRSPSDRRCKACSADWSRERFARQTPEEREAYNARQRARYARKKASA